MKTRNEMTARHKTRILVFLLVLLTAFQATAQQTTKYNTIQELVPKGWKLIKTVYGDLNKDSIADVALVIEKNSKSNIKVQHGLGSDTINTNPRKLIIAFKDKAGTYTQAAVSEKLIPPPGSLENACLDDPLDEGDVIIAKGVLKISLHYWWSCGTYEVDNNTFTFRYQHDHFELIGLDLSSFSRSTHASTDISINFSTRQKQKTTAESDDDKPVTKKEAIKTDQLITLEETTEHYGRKYW